LGIKRLLAQPANWRKWIWCRAICALTLFCALKSGGRHRPEKIGSDVVNFVRNPSRPDALPLAPRDKEHVRQSHGLGMHPHPPRPMRSRFLLAVAAIVILWIHQMNSGLGLFIRRYLMGVDQFRGGKILSSQS
jgi:hypothetical protein